MVDRTKIHTSVRSLYIHFPFCRHLCNYCDFFKTVPQDESAYAQFEVSLRSSITVHRELLENFGAAMEPLETLYIGGGTPSLWSVAGANFINWLFEEMNTSWNKVGHEATLEVNPGSWDKEGLDRWQEAGINRFSVGVQSMDGRFLPLLDRIHNLEDVDKTLKELHARKANFSVDLMLGLPDSEPLGRDVVAELEKLLSYRPNHVSVYILTVKGNYALKDRLPPEEYIETEYLAVSEYLKSEGMLHYEVSNFAYPGKESQHNLAYWHGKSVGALGPSATGLLVNRGQGLRYKWRGQLPQMETEILGPKELKLEELYLGLRTDRGVNLESLISEGDQSRLHELCVRWRERGLVESVDPLRLTSRGYLIMDSLMGELFSTLKSL